MKRISKAILISIVALLIASMPILAAVAYRAIYTIIESGGNAYDRLAVIEAANNTWLSDNGFIEADALDTRIETLGGLIKPHMVVSNKTLTAVPVPANSQTNLYFTTANSDLSSMDIIIGTDGFVTVSDDATLELGSDFEIEQSGYVDTTGGADVNLVYKEDAFRTYASATGSITSEVVQLGISDTLNLLPDAAGDYTNILNQTPASGAHWDKVDDPVATPDDASTYIESQSNSTQYKDSFNIAAPSWLGSNQVITSVTVYFRIYAWNSSTEPKSQPFLRLAGVESAGTETNTSPHSTWITKSETLARPGGGSWTLMDIDSLQVVIGVRGTALPSTLRVTQVYVRIIYTYDSHVEVTATGIASGEYIVKTYGVDNEPTWATGDVLHFPIGATSNINCGAIHNAAPKLWVSVWFKLDADFSAGDATQHVITKRIDGFDYLALRLQGATGQLQWFHVVGANPVLVVDSTETNWNAGQWYHAIASLSDDGLIQTDARLIVDGGTPVTDEDAGQNPAPNGGNFVIGDRAIGNGLGFEGVIANVIVGTDDLTVPEEAALYAGIAPGDETNYWYIDEGTGTTAYDYGTGGNDGTIDAAPTWETATFTTGSTGRLTDFYIEVDDGVLDPDRWGTNLKGVSVTDNSNDWILNQNNVMPYMEYYKHTVSGVEHAWYQPNYMVEATDHDGEEDVGGSDTTITDATMTEAPGYWVGALVTITGAGGAAPEGEARVCTVFAAGGVITVSPAFSANVDIGDTFTVDFGTLIDRSYYGIEFDGADDIVACGADVTMDITDTATLTAWVYIDSDGENNEGSIIDRRDATPDGYRLYVSSEAAGDVAIEAILDGVADAYAVSNVEVSISGWHYIVAVYNRLGTFHWEIYEDGVLLGLGTDQAGVAPITGHTANVMNIGDNAASNRGFDGRIDEPSFYTTAWTQALVTANYNVGAGLYTPTDTTSIALQLHMEEGSGAAVADTSGNANDGTITNAVWINGQVPRPAGNSGTNDSRVTWGVNPTGVAVTLGGMVSEAQPVPGVELDGAARDIMPPIEVSDWYVGPDISGSLLTNPLRPFVTMLSDNSNLTELQAWRLYGSAVLLMITVGTAYAVRGHQGITVMVTSAALLGLVVLTIYPMWTLVLVIIMFIGGLVMERSASL